MRKKEKRKKKWIERSLMMRPHEWRAVRITNSISIHLNFKFNSHGPQSPMIKGKAWKCEKCGELAWQPSESVTAMCSERITEMVHEC